MTTEHFSKLFPTFGPTPDDIGRLEMIKHCSFTSGSSKSGKENGAQCIEQFHNILTNRGICTAFNSISPTGIFKAGNKKS